MTIDHRRRLELAASPSPESERLPMYTASRRSADQLKKERKQLRRALSRNRHAESIPLLSTLESRALSAQLAEAGAALVPEGFLMHLETALLTGNPIRQLARVTRQPTGANIAMPQTDDTSIMGQVVIENTRIPESDLSFQLVNIKPYRYSSTRAVAPRELFSFDDGEGDGSGDAMNGDNEEWLGRLLGERIARAQLNDWTNGAQGGNLGVLNLISQIIAAASSSAIAADDLLALPENLNPAHLESPSIGYMMHPFIWSYVKRIKDGAGRNIFLQNGPIPHIGEFPVYRNIYMPSTIVSGNKTVLFGAWDQVRIVDVGPGDDDGAGVQIIAYSEASGLAENDQIAVQGRLRSAMAIHDPAGKAFAMLRH